MFSLMFSGGFSQWCMGNQRGESSELLNCSNYVHQEAKARGKHRTYLKPSKPMPSDQLPLPKPNLINILGTTKLCNTVGIKIYHIIIWQIFQTQTLGYNFYCISLVCVSVWCMCVHVRFFCSHMYSHKKCTQPFLSLLGHIR